MSHPDQAMSHPESAILAKIFNFFGDLNAFPVYVYQYNGICKVNTRSDCANFVCNSYIIILSFHAIISNFVLFVRYIVT